MSKTTYKSHDPAPILKRLEANSQSGLALSEQKAEEAKLTDSVGVTRPDPTKKQCGSRRRRPIRELILRELSFQASL
jgi:hypothetical protein